MPFLDRDSFITLLNSLGSPDDAEALAAAREIDRRMRDAGITWNDLLMPPPGADARLPVDDDPDAAPEGEIDVPVPVEEHDEDLALIDRMLGAFEMSDATRRELLDFKSDIAAGEFTARDRRYLHDLKERLAARQTP